MSTKKKTENADQDEQQPMLSAETSAPAAPVDSAVGQPPATNDEEEPEVEYTEVMVLRDEPAYGLRCGQTATLDMATAKQLHKSGGVDLEPAAVEAGKANQPQADAPDVIED